MDGYSSVFLILATTGIFVIFGAFRSAGVLASTVGSALSWVREHVFTRTMFFWLVNIVFMAISAYHAAPFFSSVVASVPGLEWVGPHIGLPVAIVLDGVTILFMQARLESNYKRDKKKASMYLRYVFASAGLNTLANLYTDIQHFQAKNYNNVGAFLLMIAPLVLSIFPMFLVAISKAADEMVSIKPLEKMDVEEYKKEEEKRVQILEAQNVYLEREATAEKKRIEIEQQQQANDRLRKGKLPTQVKQSRPLQVSFFWGLVRFGQWESDRVVVKGMNEMKTAYEAQSKTLNEHLQRLQDAYSSVPEVPSPMTHSMVISENTGVNTQVSQAFTKQELQSEQLSVRRQNTEEMMVVDPRSVPNNVTPLHTEASSSKRTGEASKRAARILKKYPNIGASELATKAKISRSYATKLLTQQTELAASNGYKRNGNGHAKARVDDLVELTV